MEESSNAVENQPEAQEPKKNYQIEEVGPCKKKITFEIPAEKIKFEYENNMRELLSHAQVKGFRKGKVPRNMLERKHRKDLLEEVKSNLLQNSFQEAIEDSGLKPLDEPHLHYNEITVELDKPLHFHLTVEVEPQFELGDYKDIEVEVETSEVTDSQVEDSILRLRKRHAKMEEKAEQKVSAGDQVEIRFTLHYEQAQVHENESYEYEWSTQQISGIKVEGFEEAILGKTPGEEFSVAVNVPKYLLNEEQIASLNEEGTTPGEMRIVLKKVSVVTLAELNEAFFETHGEGAKTEEEFRQKIRERLEEQNSNLSQRLIGQKTLEKLMVSYQFDVPVGVLEKHLSRQFQSSEELNALLHNHQELFQGANKEDVHKMVREAFDLYKTEKLEEAKKEFRERTLLERIAKKERIYVTEQEVEFRVQFLAQLQGIDVDHVMERFRQSGQLEAIRADMKAEKTIELLGKQAKVKEIPKTEKKA